METTTVPAVPPLAEAPLNRRYTWVALIIAAALPLVIFGAVIILLASANYNFLEWME